MKTKEVLNYAGRKTKIKRCHTGEVMLDFLR
jgi:hypothetical protein